METDTLSQHAPERHGEPRTVGSGAHFAAARPGLSPADESPFLARLRSVGSLLTILLLLVGVPLALALLVGWPLPTKVPSWDRISDAFQRDGVPVEVLINGLAVVVWLAWAQLAWALGAEAAAVIKGRTARRAGILPGTQLLARHLVTSAALVISSVGMIRPAVATPLTALQEAEPVTAEPALRASEPAPAGSPATPASAASTGSAGRSAPAVSPTGHTPTPAEQIHVVQRGDTFWGLAEQYLGNGLRWREIRDRNVGRAVAPGHVLSVGEDHIEVGWRLLVPGSPSSTASMTPLPPEPPTAPPELAPPGTILASLGEKDAEGAYAAGDDEVAWSAVDKGEDLPGASTGEVVEISFEPVVFTMEAEEAEMSAAAPAGVEPAATPLGPVEAEAPASAPAPTLEQQAPAPAPAPVPPSGPVTVEPGDHFWGLAERQLEAAWGRPVTAEEVAPYWRSLVEANRDRLTSGDPDLIYPGENFSVPSPPSGPGAAPPAATTTPAPPSSPSAPAEQDGEAAPPAADEAPADQGEEAAPPAEQAPAEEGREATPPADEAPADRGEEAARPAEQAPAEEGREATPPADEAPADQRPAEEGREAPAEEGREAAPPAEEAPAESESRAAPPSPPAAESPADQGASDGAPPEQTSPGEVGTGDDSVAAPPSTGAPTTTAAPTTTSPPTTAAPTTTAPPPTTAAPTTTAPPATTAPPTTAAPEEAAPPATEAPADQPEAPSPAERGQEEARGGQPADGQGDRGDRGGDDTEAAADTDDDGDEATVPIVPVAATAALAGLILAALARRRRMRGRSVRPGDIVEPRLADDITFERSLAVAAGDVLDVVGAASRALGSILAVHDLPLVVALVVAPSRTVTVHFAEACSALPPFVQTGPDRWEMYPEDIEQWLGEEASPVLDTLTAVGQTDAGDWVFLDLESLGAVELAGEATVAAEVAQSMVAELSLQPVAEPLVDLTIVGMDELAPSVVEQGVVRVDHLDQDLVHRVERSAEQTAALLSQHGLRSTAAARARGLAGDGLFVMVVAYGGAEPVDPVLLERVASAAAPGGHGVAVLAVGSIGPGTTRIIVTADGRAHIPRLGLTVEAARLARHDLDQVADLLAREPEQSTRGASRPLDVDAEVAEPLTVTDAAATAGTAPGDQPIRVYEEPPWRYKVRIFADHLVETADGEIVSFRYGENPDVPNKNTHRGPELLAYLALSGRAASATDVRDHLWWDRPVALGTVNKLLYGTRKVLGGADLLSLAQDDPVGRYRLSPEVVTDVELLSHALEHGHAIAAQEPDAAAEILRRQLEGIEAVAFRGGAMGQGLAEWAAAYRVIDRVEQPVIDAALLVAKLCTQAGPDRYDEALWAVERGLTACPINEALVRAAMEIEARMGRTEGVNNRYLTLATTLARDELEPEAETSDLRARLGGSPQRDRTRRNLS